MTNDLETAAQEVAARDTTFDNVIPERLWVLTRTSPDRKYIKIYIEINGIEKEVDSIYVGSYDGIISNAHNLTWILENAHMQKRIEELEEEQKKERDWSSKYQDILINSNCRLAKDLQEIERHGGNPALIVKLQDKLRMLEIRYVQDIKKEREISKLLEEALSFYADYMNYSVDYDTSQNGFSRRCVLYSDIEERNEATGLAGRRARATLAEVQKLRGVTSPA